MNGMPHLTVLIVEDDRSIRNVHRFLLEIAGYNTVEAPDPPSAIDALRTHPTGMVALLDWEMPKAGCMRILRALAHIPTHEVAARHRYIVVALTPERLHSQLLTLPASLSITVIRKPVGMDKLLAAVGEAARGLSARPPDVGSGDSPSPEALLVTENY